MRRILRFLFGHYNGFGFRYTGDLPAGYPAPGSEFVYKGEIGYINFYCLYIKADGNSAELYPVVSYGGREDLCYPLDKIYPGLKVNVVV